MDGVDRAQPGRARGQHHGAHPAGAQQFVQGVEVHPPAAVHGHGVALDAEQPAHPAVRVVGVRAERDTPARMQFAGHEQGLQVGDGAAGGQVAEVGAEAEHRRELRGHLAFHPGGGRPAVQRVVVRVDQHGGQVAGHGGRVRGLQHLPGVPGMEERVVVREAVGELGERGPEPLVADVQRGMRGHRAEPRRPLPVRRNRLLHPPLEIHPRSLKRWHPPAPPPPRRSVSTPARSAGAEAYEASRGFPLQRGSQGSGRRAASGDRAVEADHGGHRGIVRDSGDACDDRG